MNEVTLRVHAYGGRRCPRVFEELRAWFEASEFSPDFAALQKNYEAETLSDHVIILDQGRTFASGLVRVLATTTVMAPGSRPTKGMKTLK